MHIILGLLVIAFIVGLLYMNWDSILQSITGKSPIDRHEPAEVVKKETNFIPEQPEVTAVQQPPSEPQPDAAPPKEKPVDPCQQLNAKLLAFFTHLDEQEYIAAYKLKNGSHECFANLIKKLFVNPPIVIRETDDLFAILKNTAHFYRVLGPKNIFLIREILAHEQDTIEQTMALFYQWSAMENCGGNNYKINLPLKDLYEYAGFFLNTLGGQSYLYRRDPSLRLLTKYYCILILDRANSQVINRYGIDIRYPVDTLLEEMEANHDLLGKEEYVEILQGFKEKYNILYEGNSAPVSSSLQKR